MQEIYRILNAFPHVEEAVLFGSRAKGCYRKGSDIDIALKGEKVDKDDLSAMLAMFEASLIPYFVDLVIYDRLQNKGLKGHIDRVGISFYRPAAASRPYSF